eukprot:COSAG01_NODE_2977_length_6764_cov_17.259865_2_plen_52_part_00
MLVHKGQSFQLRVCIIFRTSHHITNILRVARLNTQEPSIQAILPAMFKVNC